MQGNRHSVASQLKLRSNGQLAGKDSFKDLAEQQRQEQLVGGKASHGEDGLSCKTHEGAWGRGHDEMPALVPNPDDDDDDDY